MSKTAIIFPGIGYHTDKPLLYYAKKMAGEYGYHLVEAAYSGFESDIRGNEKKMQAAFEHAMGQAEKILEKEEIQMTDEVICISKSVGTVVAAAWQKKYGIKAKNIYFTPVEATFRFAKPDSGIVFHGTKDPWVKTEIVLEECQKLQLPLFLYEEANHSLERGEASVDLKNLCEIMIQCQAYFEKIKETI